MEAAAAEAGVEARAQCVGDVCSWPISTDASDVAESALGVLRKFWSVTVRLGRQVARRSGVAALAGMKLAGSQTGHEHAVVFNLLTLTPGQNDCGLGLLETKRVATGRTGQSEGLLRWRNSAAGLSPFHLLKGSR